MIIRVQFLEMVPNGSIIISGIQPWGLFQVPDTSTLIDVFNGIYTGKYSCGRPLDFHLYESEDFLSSVASTKSIPGKSDLMPAHPALHLKCLNKYA